MSFFAVFDPTELPPGIWLCAAAHWLGEVLPDRRVAWRVGFARGRVLH